MLLPNGWGLKENTNYKAEVSCHAQATCNGFLFGGKHVIIIGGGNAAMEDALVLAPMSKKVTVVHRREEFCASKVDADNQLVTFNHR